MATIKASPPSYTLIRKLGTGTTSKVYLASPSAQPTHLVAIKTIKKQRLHSRLNQSRLLHEIALLKQLCNDHVVQLIDFQWDSLFVYLVFEYCDMHTLSEYISNHQARRLPEHISKRFLRQIVAGMKFLFDHHIIHRDLKSHNIFMKKNQYNVPILKIGDFGIADSQLTTHYDETLQDTSLEPHGSERVLRDRIGTLLYMAPEVLCDTSYDNRCDIWSIGVMFYEMLVGHTPFAAYAQSTTTLMKCILNIPTDALSPRVGITLSAETRQILQELLQPLPNNRITFERLFNHEYIDLAHLPCELSFQKGTELIQKARIYDEQMQKMSPNTTADNAERALKKTIDVYEEGASHLLASVEFRGVYNAKEVQGTIIECLNRIEALKEAKESLSKSKHLEQGWGFGSWFKGWSGTDVI